MPTIKGFKMVNGKITKETIEKMKNAGVLFNSPKPVTKVKPKEKIAKKKAAKKVSKIKKVIKKIKGGKKK